MLTKECKKDASIFGYVEFNKFDMNMAEGRGLHGILKIDKISFLSNFRNHVVYIYFCIFSKHHIELWNRITNKMCKCYFT